MKFLIKVKWNPSIGIPKEAPVSYTKISDFFHKLKPILNKEYQNFINIPSNPKIYKAGRWGQSIICKRALV